MPLRQALLLAPFVIVLALVLPSLAYASSSEQFRPRGQHIFDDWGIFRTRVSGSDGFLALTPTNFEPILARESLGEHIDVAWELGQEFAQKYPDSNQRAEQIFYFVRDRVVYTSDADQFGRDEFAQNADEVAATILNNRAARGDCEDSAFLLAVLYKAAGYRSAMVLVPGHIATLVYLPEYKKASRKLTLVGEPGWVWAEATGETNPFGWVPEALIHGDMIAREVTLGELEAQSSAEAPIVETVSPEKGSRSTSTAGLLTFMGAGGLLWVMSGRRGGASRQRRRQ